MNKELYEQISKEINKYDVITESEYKKLCSIFNEKDLKLFIETELNNCNEEKMEEYTKKYQIFLEEEVKNDNVSNEIILHDDIVTDWFNSVKDIPLLTIEEEKELGEIILEGKQNIIIEKTSTETLKNGREINFNKIFVSIKNEKDLKLLTKLYKSEVLNNNEKKIVKLYLENYKKSNSVLNIDMLKEIYPDIWFNTSNSLESDILEKQVDLLIKFRKAKQKMIESNLKLVIYVAKRYHSIGLEQMDLLQEGSIGLGVAADKFDVSKGYKFSTYAICWIRQAMTRAIADQSMMIRIPVHMFEKTRNLKGHIANYFNLYGHEPSTAELVEITGLSEEQIVDMKKIMNDTVSLDTPVGQEEDTTIMEFVANEEETIEDIVNVNVIHDAVHEVLENLTPREREVIKLRFGIDCDSAQTLDQIGKKIGITRERVRQIEVKTLRKMQHRSFAKDLRGLI